MVVYDLSYDPRDPFYDAPGIPGVRWGLQIFTAGNLYGLDPERARLTPDAAGLHLACDGLSWGGQQQRAPGRVEARVTWRDGALTWRVEAWHDETVKAVKLLLRGLPEGALAGGWWHPTAAADEVARPTAAAPLEWRYPSGTQWLTPWACAGEGAGAVCLSARDPLVRPKRLFVHVPPYAGGPPEVELVCDEDATRRRGHFASPEMRLRVCDGSADVDNDFAAHLAFLEEAYGLPHWEERSDAPAWVRDARLLLNLHGQHWTGYVFNTFDRMAETLRVVTRDIPGGQVLGYLPGWEGRYYYAYPRYQAGADLGGEVGFRRLLATARELGVHLMPMFGANGANAPLYPDWERAAFKSPSNRFIELINLPDWDGDRAAEDDQLFLNPGEPNWRRHLLDQISTTVRQYDLDTIYLDTTGCWFNDPRHNLYDGYRALLSDLRERHPGLLVVGEGWWDAMMALFPINQTWLGVERRLRRPELLTRYARALPYLSDGTPGPGSSGVHEAGYRPSPPMEPTPGHIPSLGITEDTLALYGDEAARICRAAATRQPWSADDPVERRAPPATSS